MEFNMNSWANLINMGYLKLGNNNMTFPRISNIQGRCTITSPKQDGDLEFQLRVKDKRIMELEANLEAAEKEISDLEDRLTDIETNYNNAAWKRI